MFTDANILFSDSDYRSATRILFDAACRYGAQLVTNAHVWEETERNIMLKRPQLANGFSLLAPMLEKSQAFTLVADSGLPAQDIPVLCGAIGSRCTHLWTGDKQHFGKWYGKIVHGVTVISSRMLVDYLAKKGWK
jgi:hypothetical protein